MPESPPSERHEHPRGKSVRPRALSAGDASAAGVGYAELHCLSNFSFLRGASHPEELVARAAELGYAGLAITDRNSLAGVVRAHVAAREHGLHLLIGAEITPVDAPPLVLIAPDRAAYGRLSRLITRGRLRTPKGRCAIYLADVAQLGPGLIAIVLPDTMDAAGPPPLPGAPSFQGWPGAPPFQGWGTDNPCHLNRGNRVSSSKAVGRPTLRPCLDPFLRYRQIFHDQLYLAAELTYDQPDHIRLAELAEMSERIGIPLVAANAVHYHVPERRYLQDVLTCIREQCTLTAAGRRLFSNAERHLRARDEIARRYAACPQVIARTLEIATRCRFSLDELRYEYPHELCPEHQTATQHLAQLTWRGARQRYPSRLPENVRRLLERELALIAELQYESYFLTVWDLVRFARQRGILCQGRGSAANSAVCYCLGITAVDPARIDLLFERFISHERNEPPDIDVDFEHQRREEVFQYVYNKYGRERAAITAEVITYRPRSAVRDVGKVLGLSLDRLDVLAKTLDWWSEEPLPDDAIRAAGLDPRDRMIQMLVRLVRQLLGFPRHLSQHVGGFIITETPLCEIVPLDNGAMPGRTFIEWDKDDIDALGILKVDCLALGMLTAINKCFKLLRSHEATAIPPEDPAVYDMICQADTVGVFQIESRAQMSMLPRLKPRCFYDLVIEVAIVRPGPIQGGMVHPYLRRRHGLEPVTYPSDQTRRVLEKTLGVPLFQEQVMRLAVVAAGFTPGEADQLRRAMAAWRRSGRLDQFKLKLIRGMLANGYSRQFAEQIYKQIRGFGEYGFPESHAASFALLVYASAWLKRYHPAAFCAALLNSQPLGFYTPGQLVRDTIAHGVPVLPMDVNASGWDCRLEERDRGREGRRGGGSHEATEPRSHEGGERDGGMEACRMEEEPRASARAAVRLRDASAPATATTAQAEACGSSAQSTRWDDSSTWGLHGPALRLGLRLIRGLSEEKVRGILAARREGPIRSIRQLARRPDVARDTLVRLAAADAFRSLGLSRRQALWHILALDDDALPLLAELEPEEPPIELPAMSLDETVVQDYDTIGFSLKAHPIGLVRRELNALKVTPNERLKRLPNGRPVVVAGLVTVRQRPGTAKGIVFMTLEDETGTGNLIIHPPIWKRDRGIARGKIALLAEGHVERQGQVVHVLVRRMQDLSARLVKLSHRSRDFH